MKIGVFTYRQYPYVSANVSIAYSIAEYLKERYGAEVILLGLKQDENQESVRAYHELPIIFLNKKIGKSTRLSNKLKNVLGEKVFQIPHGKMLREIVDKERIDVLVSVVAPIQVAYIVQSAKLKIPWYLYQLDPFYDVGDKDNPRLKKDFLKVLHSATHTFTTDLLYEKYMQDTELSMLIEKLTVVEFPNLKRPGPTMYAARERNPERYTLLYAGSLYSDIRSPRILLRLREILPKEYRILFLGSCDDAHQQEQLKLAGIECWGQCTPDVVKEQLWQSDVLINIGNLVRNQLGSKLIEYIATGKPILNLYQIGNCKTISVLDQYKLKLNISTESLCENDREISSALIRKFINQSVGHQENFEEIREKYYHFTPEYVGDTFAQHMGLTSRKQSK